MEFDPASVEAGVRDFLIHKTGDIPKSVRATRVEHGYVVVVKTAGVPADVVEQLRTILPDGFRLSLVTKGGR